MSIERRISLLGLCLVTLCSIGCPRIGNEDFTRKIPAADQLAGRYELRTESCRGPASVPTVCQSAASITLEKDGSFKFVNVPHCFSYESGCDEMRLNVSGKWTVTHYLGGWGLHFDWNNQWANGGLHHQAPPYEIYFEIAPDRDASNEIMYKQK